MNQEEIESRICELEFSIQWQSNVIVRRRKAIKIYQKDIAFSQNLIKQRRKELRKLRKDQTK